MRPKLFYEVTFFRNAQSRIFESQGLPQREQLKSYSAKKDNKDLRKIAKSPKVKFCLMELKPFFKQL